MVEQHMDLSGLRFCGKLLYWTRGMFYRRRGSIVECHLRLLHPLGFIFVVFQAIMILPIAFFTDCSIFDACRDFRESVKLW